MDGRECESDNIGKEEEKVCVMSKREEQEVGRVGLSALGITHQGHPVRLVDPVLHCLVDELGVGW